MGFEQSFEYGTPEEKLLGRQALDKAAMAQKSCAMTNTKFLTPAESAFLKVFCRKNKLSVWFDGGKSEAERVVACFFPEWQSEYLGEELSDEESPVAVLKASNTAGAELSHRDYLGALMALGIRRDVLGDIDVHGSECYVFCLSEMAEYIMNNVEMAGRARLSWSLVKRSDVPPAEVGDGEALYCTVPSLRLDAVIAEGFDLSREDTKMLVKQGSCSIDHMPTLKPDAVLDCGMLVSVKGKGRLKLERIKGETRRGRIGIELTRFGKKR